MYAVFYRLGGYEETWRQVPDDLIGSYSLAAPIAQTVQATLRHIGYPFAQAEARKLTNADDPPVQPAPEMLACTGCGQKTTDGAWLRGEVGDRWYCGNCINLLNDTQAIDPSYWKQFRNPVTDDERAFIEGWANKQHP